MFRYSNSMSTTTTGGKITPGGTAHGSHPSSSRKVAWERRQVWEGKATKTSSGMKRHQLHKNPKTGKIVSKKKHMAAKAAKNLGAHLGKGF